MVEAERFVVSADADEWKIDADNRYFLGAGKQPCIGGSGCARADCLCIEQIIGLKCPDRAEHAGRETRLQARACVRQQGGGPIFVGDAEPAIGDVPTDGFFVLDVFVGEFLQARLSEHADEAFMQDVVSGCRGDSVTRDQSVRK